MRLAVVSSNSEENVRRVLGHENAGLIDHYGLRRIDLRQAAEVQAGPAPERRAGAQAICIGDEVRDAEAARSLGIPFAAVSWGYAKPELLAGPGAGSMFTSVGDITAAIRG